MDSGATHRFTPNITQLDSPIPYHSTEQVIVGDGKQLLFSHIDYVSLATSSKPLLLHKTLCTLSLTHNLISDTRLCTNNRAFIEFYPLLFLVKDQFMKKVLFQGHLENGLYKVQPPPFTPFP